MENLKKFQNVINRDGMPGTVMRVLPEIKKYNVKEMYSVDWVDGTSTLCFRNQISPITGLRRE